MCANKQNDMLHNSFYNFYINTMKCDASFPHFARTMKIYFDSGIWGQGFFTYVAIFTPKGEISTSTTKKVLLMIPPDVVQQFL